MTGDRPRSAVMDPVFIDDLEYWIRADRRLALRIMRLVDDVLRDPFTGAGKPERLRGPLGGKWSRRIDQEHRLLYEVADDHVYFLSARRHY